MANCETCNISIHAPLAGRDLQLINAHRQAIKISIHAPLAGRDCTMSVHRETGSHFNPRAPCGARQRRIFSACIANRISIHAPLAGRDELTIMYWSVFSVFQSTRPLRGATRFKRPQAGRSRFQSTRPLRGATSRSGKPLSRPRYFNPRAPCGARREGISGAASWLWISIHAPLAGRDSKFDEFLSANLRKSNKKRLAERGENAA